MDKDNMEQNRIKFLKENDLEVVAADSDDELNGIIDSIDLENQEVWFMQCPKNFDISKLKQQQFKLPGRTHLSQLEVSATKFVDKPQQAIGYAHKSSYKVRLLPITGSIVVRDNLKSTDNITTEKIEAACQHAARPTLPENLKDRHPLFGQHYKKQLRHLQSVIKRLNDADDNSSAITKTYRYHKPTKPTIDTTSKTTVTAKPNKSKKHAIEPVTTAELNKRLKIKDEVAEDLKWLENV